MEFNKEEFDSLTQKLEQYAAQLSTLQTKLELQPEIESMKNELACLRQKLDVVTAERDELAEKYEAEHQRCEELDNQMTTAMVENAWLKNCIILSLANIRAFMRKVRRLEIKSLFLTFLHKTILPEMGARSIQAIDSKQKWAGAQWLLRWLCNYPAKAQDFCNKIATLPLPEDLEYKCEYNNIRPLSTLSFMNEDARNLDTVKYSKNDETIFFQLKGVVIALTEELQKTANIR